MDDDVLFWILLSIFIGGIFFGCTLGCDNDIMLGNICESLDNDTGYYYYGKYHDGFGENRHLECGKILIVNETERKGIVWQDDT